MIPVDEALARVTRAVTPTSSETVATGASLGRVLADAVHSPHALPRFEQSAVDGYAVRVRDVHDDPVVLPISCTIPAAGHSTIPTLESGTAARIFTGGVLPSGADTVVRQELTRRGDDSVEILSTVEPGTDVRRAGEELSAGALIASAGTSITAGLLGALAFVGCAHVEVRRRPVVRVLVTGDEVVPLGSPLLLGQVPDANGPLVSAHLTRWDVASEPATHVADQASAVRDALDRAFDSSDLVLSTGGVSVGDLDFVPSVAEALGAERIVWKVAQKPGMPIYIARRGRCVLIGLPGNPGAVLVNLHIFVRHALDVMLGRDPSHRWHRAPCPDNVPREDAKTFWLRAVASDDRHGPSLRPLGGQGSHMLANLAEANALVRIPGRDESATIDHVAWTALTD